MLKEEDVKVAIKEKKARPCAKRPAAKRWPQRISTNDRSAQHKKKKDGLVNLNKKKGESSAPCAYAGTALRIRGVALTGGRVEKSSHDETGRRLTSRKEKRRNPGAASKISEGKGQRELKSRGPSIEGKRLFNRKKGTNFHPCTLRKEGTSKKKKKKDALTEPTHNYLNSEMEKKLSDADKSSVSIEGG